MSPAGAGPLLAARRLTWGPATGWTWDAWLDDPAAYALAGANSRFSLPAVGARLAGLAADAAAAPAALVGALARRARGGGGGGGGGGGSS